MQFWYTEKGKLGLGILGAVLITAAIVIPTTILLMPNNNIDKDSIQTYSYKADASTTNNALGKMVGLNAPEDMTGDGSYYTEDAVLYLNENNQSFNEILEDQQMVDGVLSTNGIGYGNAGAIGNTWENGDGSKLIVYEDDATTQLDLESFRAPLNINMKVPLDVANLLRDHLASGETVTQITSNEITDAGLDEYYNTIVKGHEVDFAISFGFYNYITFSEEAFGSIEGAGYGTEGIFGEVTDEEFKTWFTTTFSNIELPTGTYQLSVDGSSTPNSAMESIIKGFNDGEIGNFDIVENLNNQGSSGAWSGDQTIDIPLGPTSSLENTGSASTFLGTASSNASSSLYVAWGYENGALATTDSSINPVILDKDNLINEGSVLGTTLAVDVAPTFFTSKNTKVINYDSENHDFETPIGITQKGLYDAYWYGVSWNDLSISGDLLFDSGDVEE